MKCQKPPVDAICQLAFFGLQVFKQVSQVAEHTVVRLTNECYALDEFLGRFSARRTSFYVAEAPFPLCVSCE